MGALGFDSIKEFVRESVNITGKVIPMFAGRQLAAA